MKYIKTFKALSESLAAEQEQENVNAEELEEGIFDGKEGRKKTLEADFKKYELAWSKKGFKISKEQYEEEMKNAEKDKFEGKWGVDQSKKTVRYRTSDEIAWGTTQHSFGSGTN